jgi:GAF domain-containing protein
LGETVVSQSPRAGSAASFRSSEGGVDGRDHIIAVARPPPGRAAAVSDANTSGRSADFLAELTGLLLSEATVSGLLDLIVNLAVSGVEGVTGASVSMLVRDGDGLETTNASSERFRHIDQAQYRDSAGPCVQAIRTGEETTVTIPAQDWIVFSDQAAQAGVRSVWSLPLSVRERTTGALNLYSTTRETWEDPATTAARGLARQAAVVLANAATVMSAQLANQHLEQALESRDLIGQAKGILMVRQSMTADEAFDILRRASQRSNRKLRDVAADLVAGVDRPEGRI